MDQCRECMNKSLMKNVHVATCVEMKRLLFFLVADHGLHPNPNGEMAVSLLQPVFDGAPRDLFYQPIKLEY